MKNVTEALVGGEAGQDAAAVTRVVRERYARAASEEGSCCEGTCCGLPLTTVCRSCCGACSPS